MWFSRKQDLTDHIEQEHKFVCINCDSHEMFSTKNELHDHIRNYHTNKWDQWEIDFDFPTDELLIQHKYDFHSQKSSTSIDYNLKRRSRRFRKF